MLLTKVLLPALLLTVSAAAQADQLDLDLDRELSSWNVVVDGVMGGRSTGTVTRSAPGVLQFSGTLSLANNGGFSQIRRSVSGDQFTDTRAIEITVRGDGRAYRFDIRCANARVPAGGFQTAFPTTAGAWETIVLPYEDFELITFGRRVPNAPPLAPTMIESIGFTLSDKVEAPFRLEVRSIRAIGDDPAPTAVSSRDLATISRRATLEKLRRLAEADERETTPEPATAARARAARLAELAVDRGVPLFNNGQPAACAAVYEVTIEAMRILGADLLGTSVMDRLTQGLADAEQNRDPQERAWTYRRTLDDVYVSLTRQAAMRR
ncbi:MAG: CIA30 family protein [Phycisphaerales bacterium]|nr:CIA30 family protein [Phycisphaerae bacterium]NNF44958.1 CIA30 family protein [Phycisphaerales bacterium]NNM25987.1 CIA30 family protein [Phycisphaerales bacterium]